MANLNGYQVGGYYDSPSYTKPSAHLPTIMSTNAFIHDLQDYGEIYTSAPDAGAFLSSLPPIKRKASDNKPKLAARLLGAANAATGPAYERVGRYSDDFYHRIHIIPPLLDLGNLISTQYRTIEVWNAHFYTVDLTDVQVINGSGIIVTPPVGTPYTMGALESLSYDVSISADGPPAIDTTIRWTIDEVVVGFADYDAGITGNRVIPFPFLPDWAKDQTESLEWKTDVIKSYDGLEQRAKIRSKPRRYQSYYYTLQGVESQSLENLLWGWQSRLYAVPFWTDVTITYDALTVGQTVIFTDVDNYAYTIGSLLLISNGRSDVFEMQEIESIGAGSIVLKKGLDNNWPGPSLIAPANMARIDGDFGVKFKRDHSNMLQGNVQFLYEPIGTDPWIPTSPIPDTYLTAEILLAEPNWRDGLETEFNSEAKVLDFETGGFAISVRSGIPEIVHQYKWLLKSRQELTAFRAFLGRRSGKFAGFWMPSWRNDFTLTQTVTSGSNGFQAYENYYGLLVDAAVGRNHVMIFLRNGTYVLKEISSAGRNSIDPSLVDVVTTTTMGADFEPSDVKIACIIGWYRLFNDRVTLTYPDKHIAEVTMSLANVLP